MQAITRFTIFCIFSSLILSGCGGGGAANGGGLPSSRPAGSVGGVSQLGLIQNGAVNVYDFSQCKKGPLLASGTTDSNGHYKLSVTHPDGPLLVEVGFGSGSYKEEASSDKVTIKKPDDGLRAVIDYKSGDRVSASATFWTNLATGLAEYEAGTGTSCSTAIQDANKNIGNLIGVNIIKTTPIDITDSANLTSSISEPVLYGMFNGAISQLTYNVAQSTPTPDPYQLTWNSLHFSNIAYNDIKADGFLDGTDANGQLSFGNLTLSADVYRHQLANSLLEIARNKYNKTGITATMLASNAQNYNLSSDTIFGNSSPTAYSKYFNITYNMSIPNPVPGYSIGDTPLWYAIGPNNVLITGTVSNDAPLKDIAVYVDGTKVGSAGNDSNFSYTLSPQSLKLSTGFHELVLIATDVLGDTGTTVGRKLAVDFSKITASASNTIDIVGNQECQFHVTYTSPEEISSILSNYTIQGSTVFPATNGTPSTVNVNVDIPAANVKDTVNFTVNGAFGAVYTFSKSVEYVQEAQASPYCYSP